MFYLCRNQVVGFYQKNEKHLWKCGILSKDAGHRHVFFKHFATKKQLPGLPINGTLVKCGLT